MSCGVVIYNLIGGLKSELSDLGLCPSSLISSKRGDSFSKILENGCRVSRQLNNILLFSGVTFCYSMVLRRRNDHSSRLILIDRSEKIPTLILLSNGKIMGANSAGSCSFRYTVVYFFKGSIIQYSRTPELR